MPSTLKEAIELLEQDDVLMTSLGNNFMNTFIASKKAEWAQYHSYVSSWEIDKYLKGY
ncbi:hypothetical protein [Bacillus sp. T3]|uniref:hypothetical protein n=1 Tax=Bacillus sp. T3 TaxID=467262 RepID=UPI00298128C3|nr:hypothetical protein [Bacillus sp. T3]